ncbi:T9SS type B sorting domain-containing protein [Crocinitomix algicola]|uniref:T9SS type B sorting domain-containing protein n=1 Tax=Crocinitomix algicola TaxID=1740263 RepID=UPI00082A9126|nr:gliding motility-associated C-terminal domain-containing protein [Crocinitomix algicola]
MNFYTPKPYLFLFLFFLCSIGLSQEDCDNGIDDDGDGLIDCLDPDCIGDEDACPAFSFPGSCLPIGYIPDITGTEGGYKPGGSVDDVEIAIPAATNRASIIIQGVYQQAPVDAMTGVNDLNHAQERIVWGRVEFDLDKEESSGWVEYAVNNHESKRYSWVDQPLSPASTDTYTRVGHDFDELLDFEFVFDVDGGNIVLGCDEEDIDISYYTIFYGNFDSQSLTSIPGADPTQYPVYYDAGPDPINLTADVDMLSGADAPDYIQIRAIGINQNRRGNSGVLVQDTREEAMSIKYIIIDLATMTASGNMTVNNGNIPAMNSTFTFSDYDVTSGLSIVDDATLLGDSDGNTTPPDQIAVCDMTLEVTGDVLTMTRSDEHGADFNEIYYVEFLRYSDQPYTSSFYLTQNAYSGPEDISFDPGPTNDGVSVDGYVDFTIPQGSKRGYLEIRANGLYSPYSLASFEGPAPSNTTRTNGNQMYAFTEVNFDLEETTGYFVTITTSTEQQLYAWQEVPIDPFVDITDLDIYGQLPNNDERLNFEIIEPNTFRVHMENDKIAYERILNMTFMGSKVNLVYSTFEHNDELTTGCDSVHFDMEICNSGGTDLTLPVPVSFYTADPTTDPTAIYLQTEIYDLDIDQGQCETFTFAIDISSLGGALTGDITIVLNDDGSFAGAPGEVIPTTFDPEDLGDQDSPVLECEYNFNIITSDYELTLPPEPTITFNEDLFIICPTDEVTITSETDGTFGDLNYEWSPEGGDESETTVSPEVTTWYYLTVTDECHTVKDSVKIEIGTVDVSEIDITEAETCPGVPGVLGDITIIPDNPDWTYTLSGGGDVYGPTGDPYFSDLTGGVYYLLNIVDGEGCFLDTTIYVGLGDNEVTADFVMDSLRDVSCFEAGDGGAYITNIEGGITPPYNVIWSNLGGPYDIETGVPVGGGDEIDNLYGDTWTVTVLDEEGCAWSHVFDIFEPDELTIEITFNNPSCFQFSDGSVTVNAEGGNDGKIYEIRNSESELLNEENSNTANTLPQGTYTVTVTDENGCTASGVVELIHPDQLEIDTTRINPLCYGFETGIMRVDTVYNYTGDFDQVSYFWAPNPTGINGIGANESTNLPAGDYVLTVNDENGCSKSFDFTITQPDSMYWSELNTYPAYCRLHEYQSGNGVLEAAVSGGTPDYHYQWDNIDDETSTINTTWGGRNPGNYRITAVDKNGCVLIEDIVLDSVSPIADFDVISDQLNADLKGTAVVDVEFVNQSQYFANPFNPLADTTFFWNLDYDNIDWVISHDYFETFDTTYGIGDIYNVCLVATNKNGCTDTTCKEITVFDPLLFEPVNVFSPDGDGINDVFTFVHRSQAVDLFNCVVVNRWGNVIREFDNVEEGWDGTNKNGSPSKDGTYFYSYSGVADNGEKFEGQGTITLVRKE